jgi:cytochrome c553
MNIRRFLVILLLLLLPLQATLAVADSCCIDAKAMQAGGQAAAAADAPDSDGLCCTECDFCHHCHAPFAADLAGGRPQIESIAPVPPPELRIHSFIPDIPPRPDRLR